jgi:hypothetical protein
VQLPVHFAVGFLDLPAGRERREYFDIRRSIDLKP